MLSRWEIIETSKGNRTLAPALIPAVQPVLAIAYLHAEKMIKKLIP